MKRMNTTIFRLALFLSTTISSVLGLPHLFWPHIENNKDNVGNSTKCLASLVKIVEHIKNQNYTNEVVQVLYNTGKMFNDVGYYESCMESGNLTYYLIRPIRDDLQWKFNLGICVPNHCTLEDANTLIAKDIINKHYLTHIANGTENAPEDYTSQATLVQPGTETGSWGTILGIAFGVVAGISALAGIVELVNSARENSKKQKAEGLYAEPLPEEVGQSDRDGQNQLSDDVPEKIGFFAHLTDCFNVVGTFRYLKRGRRPHFNSLNFIKMICGCILVFANEYIRRYYIGTNLDDKLAIDRSKDSLGFNLAYFSSVIYDIFFFISGVTGAICLKNGLSQIKTRNNDLMGIGSYAWFYVASVLKRFLRLAPIVYACLLYYYYVMPGLTSGPFGYLFTTTLSKTCPDTFSLSFNFFANLVKGGDYCMGWTWFIYSDFQLFLALPAIIIAFDVLPFVAGLANVSLIVTSIVSSVAMFGVYDLSLIGTYATSQQYKDFMNKYQALPWNKACFYFFGVSIGLGMIQAKKSANTAGQLVEIEPMKSDIKKNTISSVPRQSNLDENQLDLGDKQAEPELLKRVNGELKPEELPKVPIVQSNDSETGITLQGMVTTLCILLTLIVIAGSLLAFVEFSRSKDSWSSIIQVVLDLGCRYAIIATIALTVWQFEKSTPRGIFRFTKLGFQMSAGLSFYLFSLIWMEWGMTAGSVSQYYDSLMVFCYAMTDGIQALLPATVVMYFVEIPFKRIVRF